MSPKQFLEDELRNIREALDDALRFDYGASGSAGFYVECLLRHQAIEDGLKAASDANALYNSSTEISYLAKLVHKIERSHEAEFSWQFYHHIRELTESLFKESAHRHDPKKVPIIHVFAEGGLGEYKIHVEEDGEHTAVQTQILTVVFPRTLKRHVLLHAIFGHEIGHAIRLRAQFAKQLKEGVTDRIRSSGALASESKLDAWIAKHYQRAEPAAAQTLEYWADEIGCDIFGALCFGPSFCLALESLLNAVDPTQLEPGREHPPGAARIAIMARLWKACGWDEPKLYAHKAFPKAAKAMAAGIRPSAQHDKWSRELVNDVQLNDAIASIRTMLSRTTIGLFPQPKSEDLQSMVERLLRWVPPSGARDVLTKPSQRNSTFDFRSILLAGWYAWRCRDELDWSTQHRPTFLDLSQLCEVGMLHQHAIRIVTA